MLQHIRLKIQENAKTDHMRCILYVVCLFYISGMHAIFLYHSVPRIPFFTVLLFLIIQKIKKYTGGGIHCAMDYQMEARMLECWLEVIHT